MCMPQYSTYALLNDIAKATPWSSNNNSCSDSNKSSTGNASIHSNRSTGNNSKSNNSGGNNDNKCNHDTNSTSDSSRILISGSNSHKPSHRCDQN